MMDVYVTTVLKRHGVGGKIKVTYFDSDMQKSVLDLGFLTDGFLDYKVVSIEKLSTRFLIITLDGFSSYEDSQLLLGKSLYIKMSRSELKYGEYYAVDLIGRNVFLQDDGKLYGTIVDVCNFGAGDIIEIRMSDGKNIMLPFTFDIFVDDDVQNNNIIVKLPKFIDE